MYVNGGEYHEMKSGNVDFFVSNEWWKWMGSK